MPRYCFQLAPWGYFNSVKMQEVIALSTKYLHKQFSSKKQLQALIGSLIYLHKAISPAHVFVNCILTLLRNMGVATMIAIDKGTKQTYNGLMHATWR
jgi:uncharacterized protein VirK/YbjX